jgi:arylsulfatase A-like enzyme
LLNRRQFLADSTRLLVAGGGAASLLACDRAAGPGTGLRPNFVVVLADDLGFGDVGCNGETIIRTPRIDAMAAEGVRLTDFYVPSPICTQSRFGMLTGRYGIRAGMDHVLFPHEHVGIPNRELTLAGALKPLGYRSACVGKWHLGSDARFLPRQHGFDYFFGLPHSNDMRPLPLIRNEDVVEESPDQDQLTQRYTEEAVSFIQRAKSHPFLLYLSHTAPHVPLHASEAFRGRSAAGLYGDVVEELDWSTGRILDVLQELGLDDRTLVIFTSDNGPWLERGSGGGHAGPLRGGKATVYEGGIRVPFVARWPRQIPTGIVVREPASSLDFLPTFVRLAGGMPVADRILDGLDAWDCWSGACPATERVLYFYVVGELPLGLRAGRWKMHLTGTARRLYDLRTDLGESRDLALEQPEIVARLSTLTEDWRRTVEAQKLAERDG